ncbi:hypothetical protein [Aliarcobacter cryaerophilus]|uniref:Uncharacterized protein n=1 Tax=Aliarcobacter cryaerophilus TaxID=28198 RepID=A0AA46NVA2_9BACT|nr:hypothetical protein [Aliarcobacter cryaerophilus]UYF43033.1 hypothetical protein NGX11_09055 [Aliarcobacter cryaerophilus]
MKLTRIVLSLFIIYSFSYGETWREYKNKWHDTIEKTLKENNGSTLRKSRYDAYSGLETYEKIFAIDICINNLLKLNIRKCEDIIENVEQFLINNPDIDLGDFLPSVFSADTNNNNDKYYVLPAKVFAILDENSMIVKDDSKYVYVEGIPKDEPVHVEKAVLLIVKGAGEYSYTSNLGSKNIVKAIWQQNKTNNDFNVVKANEKLENSFIKKQYNENGIILEIEHPEKIIPNSYVNFKITMTNNLPYIGTKGGVSISFPQFNNLDVITHNQTLSTKSYQSNSKLWNVNTKKTISSQYFMLEGWENNWKQSQTKTIDFSVFINDNSELNNINIFIRSILISNKIEYINPINGIEGQQGYKNLNISIPIIRN